MVCHTVLFYCKENSQVTLAFCPVLWTSNTSSTGSIIWTCQPTVAGSAEKGFYRIGEGERIGRAIYHLASQSKRHFGSYSSSHFGSFTKNSCFTTTTGVEISLNSEVWFHCLLRNEQNSSLVRFRLPSHWKVTSSLTLSPLNVSDRI